MRIDTEEWTTLAEAARLLEVSPQRVSTMVDEDGLLDVVRPWPRVSLVSRRSIAEWIAGQRPERIMLADLRRYVHQHTVVDDVANLDVDELRDHALEFITRARPRWEQVRREKWALEHAAKLQRSTTHT